MTRRKRHDRNAETTVDDSDAPRWLWRLAVLILAGVVIVGLAGAILLTGGAADPPRAGPLRWSVEALPGDCLHVDGLSLPALSPPFTLESVAEAQNGPDTFTSWGVWLGSPEAGPRWEVLPPGYYRHDGQTIPFHHVRAGQNELRLDVLSGGRYVLRLNRERAAEGEISPDHLQWGLLGGRGVCWKRIDIYADTPDPG